MYVCKQVLIASIPPCATYSMRENVSRGVPCVLFLDRVVISCPSPSAAFVKNVLSGSYYYLKIAWLGRARYLVGVMPLVFFVSGGVSVRVEVMGEGEECWW